MIQAVESADAAASPSADTSPAAFKSSADLSVPAARAVMLLTLFASVHSPADALLMLACTEA